MSGLVEVCLKADADSSALLYIAHMRAGRLVVAARRAAGSRVADGALAASLGVIAVVDALYGQYPEFWGQSRWVAAVLGATAAAALAVRRTRPLGACAVALGGIVASFSLGQHESGTSVLIAFIATYSAGVYGRNDAVAVALLATFSVTTALTQPAREMLGDFLWVCLMVTLAYGTGLGIRRLRGRADTAERRAALLQETQWAAAEAAARDERGRIARELHDIISHGLGVMVLHAGAAEQVLDRDPAKVRETLRLIRDAGHQAIEELNTLVLLSKDQAPAGRTPQPTLRDIERLVATTHAAGLAVTIETEGDPRPLPATVELNAYRVIQEGLTNAVKHASNATVRVILRYHALEVEVEVVDNGMRQGPGPGTRRGLIGLRERASIFGGTFHAGPIPDGGGWSTRVSFPTAP